MPFIDPKYLDPSITPYGNCPTCGTLIRLAVENNHLAIKDEICPNCKIQIREEEIAESFVKNFILTQATSSANSIIGFDLAVPIFLVVTLFTFFSSVTPTGANLFTVIMMFIPVVICTRWLMRFGRFRIADEEFNTSKKRVKLSLALWIAAHIFNLFLWLYGYLE